MKQETYRSIGAILGLLVGVAAIMVLSSSVTLTGSGALIAGFCFGAGGCVAGGIIGERVFRKRNRDTKSNATRQGETKT